MNNGSGDPFRRDKTRVEWARLDPTKPGGVHVPKRAGDVGWDLEAMEDVVIPPMQAADVPVNGRLALPRGVWAEVRARSSIARRNLYVESGIIDTGYRGPLFVLVRNMALPTIPEYAYGDLEDPRTVVINAGERVGQLIFHLVAAIWTVEVAEVSIDTERAEDGFGSTGR